MGQGCAVRAYAERSIQLTFSRTGKLMSIAIDVRTAEDGPMLEKESVPTLKSHINRAQVAVWLSREGIEWRESPRLPFAYEIVDSKILLTFSDDGHLESVQVGVKPSET